MKKEIDRFGATDDDGKLHVVAGIAEYVGVNDAATRSREMNVSFQTLEGQRLSTTDQHRFRIAETDKFLNRSEPELNFPNEESYSLLNDSSI